MRRSAQSGFTLLELLVSLAILSMIGLLLAGTIQTGSLIWQRTQKLPDQNTQTILRGKLRTWIERAVPTTRLDLRQEFQGQTNQFSFVTSEDLPIEQAGEFSRITPRVSSAEGGDALNVVIEIVNEAGDVRYSEERRLLSDTGAIEISYFLNEGSGQGEWMNTWSDPDRLPDLISIRADRAASWPPFIVKPGP